MIQWPSSFIELRLSSTIFLNVDVFLYLILSIDIYTHVSEELRIARSIYALTINCVKFPRTTHRSVSYTREAGITFDTTQFKYTYSNSTIWLDGTVIVYHVRLFGNHPPFCFHPSPCVKDLFNAYCY